MLANPRPGQRAEIRYAKDRWAKWGRELLPYQGLRCTVVIASKGKPRNHLVQSGWERIGGKENGDTG